MTKRKDPTPMPDGLTQDYAPSRAAPPLTASQRRAAERARIRANAAKARKEAARAAAATEEARREKLAPGVQRNAVVAPNGTVLRGARIVVDGLSVSLRNPISEMVARGEGRREGGNRPLIRREHEAVVARLAQAWEEGGKGVGMAASAYGERMGGGAATSGSLSDAVLASIGHQNRQEAEYFAARQYLGTAWPIVFDVGLRGIDVVAWAAQERIMRHAAVGYLAAALDRLVEFYAGEDRPRRIRGVSVGRRGSQEVVDNEGPP